MTDYPYVLAGLAVVVLLNLIVTIGVFRDAGLNAFQKTMQSLMVWILPIVGGVSILMLLASHHTREEMKGLVPFPFYLSAAPAGPDVGDSAGIMNSDLTSDMFEGHCGGDGD